LPTKFKSARLPPVKVTYNQTGSGSPLVSSLLSLVDRISESLTVTGLARASAVGLALITSTFFLLSSFNFSYSNIVRNANVLWISKLVRSYTGLYWTVFGLNAITLRRAFQHRLTRWWAEALLIVLGTVGLLMTRVYFLSDLPLDSRNIIWSVILTLPLLCFGIFDVALYTRPSIWMREGENRSLPLFPIFLSGVLVAGWYFGIAFLRYQDELAHRASLLAVLTVTLLLHACMFTLVIALFSLIHSLTVRARFNPRVRWIASLIVASICASLVLRKLVTPALSFNNLRADLWAAVYPIAFLVMLAGWHVRRAALADRPVPDRVEVILTGQFPSGKAWTIAACTLALALPIAVPYAIERVDWNFLFQRLTAVIVWALALTMAWRTSAKSGESRTSIWKWLAIAGAMAACSVALVQSNRLWRSAGLDSISKASAAYSGMDTSWQAAQILFRPVIHDGDSSGLYSYLRRNTLITDPIAPPRLGLVEALTPVAGPKPNIYIIVVDCMRRDYLSAYNPRVQFTPHIGSFGSESFVFQHAYTNYGGTALSEPAIWAGEMLPSTLYPNPFPPMNALEQLTIADGYHRLLLRDMVLGPLLRELPTDSLLSARNHTGQRDHIGLDLRDEVAEIVNQSSPKKSGDPLFVYAQPQNLHPITLHQIAVLGEKPQGNYPGFNARYADELHKVDEAFGQFIDGLKARGQFDNSIIVLTADHGDWLGEYGRWGHGQFLLPPILEVPLLIHLPAAMARKTYSDTNQTVFLTDITPSLLYLLGHRAIRRGEFFGRPLFTEHREEQQDYFQRYHLFMSSYAPIFGVMDEQTKTLYMADALDENQSVYNLAEDYYGLDNVIDKPSQFSFEQLLRGSVARLDAEYGYIPSQH